MLRAIPAILTVARRIHAFGASRTPAQFDCTIRYWNEALQKERTHDYDTGYYTTKVAPSDIAWLQPGKSPVGRPGRVDPGTVGFVVIGSCSKGNITSSTELRNIMIKLSKLASDHRANAISYEKSRHGDALPIYQNTRSDS